METSFQSTKPQELEAEALEELYEANESDWKMLLASKAWKDLRTFIHDTIEVGKELLSEERNDRAIPESDDSLRGGIKVARRILVFPEERLNELSSISEQTREER